MERNAFLAGTPLFSGVASQEVGAMLDCLDAHERRYAQGERIYHMGDRRPLPASYSRGASASSTSTPGAT